MTTADPSASHGLRIAVAEDGGLFREGLVMLLKATDHTVVGAVADGDSLIRLVTAEPAVDVAVLDIRMPPEPDGGLTTASRLRESHPQIGLLLLSHYAEAHYLMRILEIGTRGIGYRLKDRISSAGALRETVARVAAGEIVIEPAVAERLIEHRTDRPDALSSLTDRETDVLRLMAEGRSNGGIARELFLSVKAVEKNVAAIFVKLSLPQDAAAHHRRVLAVLTYLRARRDGE